MCLRIEGLYEKLKTIDKFLNSNWQEVTSSKIDFYTIHNILRETWWLLKMIVRKLEVFESKIKEMEV